MFENTPAGEPGNFYSPTGCGAFSRLTRTHSGRGGYKTTRKGYPLPRPHPSGHLNVYFQPSEEATTLTQNKGAFENLPVMSAGDSAVTCRSTSPDLTFHLGGLCSPSLRGTHLALCLFLPLQNNCPWNGSKECLARASLDSSLEPTQGTDT